MLCSTVSHEFKFRVLEIVNGGRFTIFRIVDGIQWHIASNLSLSIYIYLSVCVRVTTSTFGMVPQDRVGNHRAFRGYREKAERVGADGEEEV